MMSFNLGHLTTQELLGADAIDMASDRHLDTYLADQVHVIERGYERNVQPSISGRPITSNGVYLSHREHAY